MKLFKKVKDLINDPFYNALYIIEDICSSTADAFRHRPRFRYNFFTDTMTFKKILRYNLGQCINTYSVNYSFELSIVNIRKLGYRNFLPMCKDVFANLDYFFRNEGSWNLEKDDSVSKIIIEDRHVELIEQVLSSERKDLGKIFLLQSITIDVITNEKYLKSLLQNQVPLDSERLKLDKRNVAYTYPYYEKAKSHKISQTWSSNSYGSQEYDISYDRLKIDDENDVLPLSHGFPVIKTMTELQLMFASFISQDDEKITFGEFLENPRFNADGALDVEEVCKAQDWLLENIEVLDFDSLENRTSGDIVALKRLTNWARGDFQGVLSSQRNVFPDSLTSNYLTVDYFVKFLIQYGNIQRIERMFDLMIIGHLRQYNWVIYLVCYVLCYDSADSADEILTSYFNCSDRSIFVWSENSLNVMEYFENADHRESMSFGIWFNLNVGDDSYVN